MVDIQCFKHVGSDTVLVKDILPSGYLQVEEFVPEFRMDDRPEGCPK
jgi:hypothetical protein